MSWLGVNSKLGGLLGGYSSLKPVIKSETPTEESPNKKVHQLDGHDATEEVSEAAEGSSKSTMTETEWDNCQDLTANVDGDYTLVEDFSVLDIKSHEAKEIPVDGVSMPTPQNLNDVIQAVQKQLGKAEVTTEDGQKVSFAKFMDNIDQSITGGYAMTYRQHATCSVLLHHYTQAAKLVKSMEVEMSRNKATTAQQISNMRNEAMTIKGKEVFYQASIQRLRRELSAQVLQLSNEETAAQGREARFEHIIEQQTVEGTKKSSRIAELEEDLKKTEQSLHEVQETLRDFALQIRMRDEQVATMHSEMQQLQQACSDQVEYKKTRIFKLRARVSALEKAGITGSKRIEELESTVKRKVTTNERLSDELKACKEECYQFRDAYRKALEQNRRQ